LLIDVGSVRSELPRPDPPDSGSPNRSTGIWTGWCVVECEAVDDTSQ
jgi:hypothetical protein